MYIVFDEGVYKSLRAILCLHSDEINASTHFASSLAAITFHSRFAREKINCRARDAREPGISPSYSCPGATTGEMSRRKTTCPCVFAAFFRVLGRRDSCWAPRSFSWSMIFGEVHGRCARSCASSLGKTVGNSTVVEGSI